MGPNEAQLRAALHEGEGESLDATALISHAVHVRRERRRRVTSIVGAAAVVAVVGLGTAGIVALGRGGDNGGGSSADAAGRAAGSSVGADQAGKVPVSNPAPRASSKVTDLPACPASPTEYRLQVDGGVTPGGSGPLFDRPVAAMRVCGYRDGAGPASFTLTGANAQSLASSLNAAPKVPSTSVKCPGVTPVTGGIGTIELLAIDARGAALVPVTVTVNCGPNPATNGTALRFVSNLPARVLKLIPVVPGHVVGSPVR
ncbi:MAG TPA: hypothetical protein VH395_11275 [Jatrophihabitantaceae bacterium]